MGVQENFPPDARVLWAVRLFVAQALVGVTTVNDIVLAASELATNVVRHAQTPFTVQVMNEGERIRLEVSDGSSIIPAVEDLTDSQRGLRVISGVADDWGIEETDSGKVVWAEFGSE